MPKYTPETLQTFLDSLPNHEKEERDLLWFFAYRDAEDMSEVLTVKELASLLQSGISPMTLESAIEDFYDGYADEEVSEDKINRDLEFLIQEFFINHPDDEN